MSSHHHDMDGEGQIALRRAIYLGQLAFQLRNGAAPHEAQYRALCETAYSMNNTHDFPREWRERHVIWGWGKNEDRPAVRSRPRTGGRRAAEVAA